MTVLSLRDIEKTGTAPGWTQPPALVVMPLTESQRTVAACTRLPVAGEPTAAFSVTTGVSLCLSVADPGDFRANGKLVSFFSESPLVPGAEVTAHLVFADFPQFSFRFAVTPRAAPLALVG